jgi:hypothetical protein
MDATITHIEPLQGFQRPMLSTGSRLCRQGNITIILRQYSGKILASLDDFHLERESVHHY